MLWIDLLDRKVEDRYAREPSLLYGEIAKASDHLEWVVIDEVQKLPQLLDTVHRVIESTEFKAPKFALTGSSSRKLKYGGANLLAGRAFVNSLFPLTSMELENRFDLEFVLNFGSLPGVFHFTDTEDVREYLRAYALTYLNEEIWAEHLVQKLDPFRKFLEVAAQSSGNVVNFANIARDVGADEKTVKRYYQILEDSLLGFFVESHCRSIRKRLIKAPKFYFFDCGVTHALARTLRQHIVQGTYDYGRAFEQFYIMELLRLNAYLKLDYSFSYLLTHSGVEIDLIVDRPNLPTALIEIKSSSHARGEDAKHLKAVRQDFQNCVCFCISNDPMVRIEDGITFLPWHRSFAELGIHISGVSN